MIEVGEVKTSKPERFVNSVQELIYNTLDRENIPFERVENSPSRSMEDAVAINERLGGRMAKNLLLCNRQRTRFYLLVMRDDKPFVTRDFSAAMGISRVSFAPAEDLDRFLGVESGAANVLSLMRPEAAEVNLVIDADLLDSETFMCPDGTVTGHLKIAMPHLINNLIPLTDHRPAIIHI